MNPAVMVVLIWAGINAVLVGVLALYGENWQFVSLYGAAVLITVLVAVAVHFGRLRPDLRRRRLPAASASAGYLGMAAALVAIGMAYSYYWVVGFAAVPALAALLQVRKERLPAGTVPAPTAVPSGTPPGQKRDRGDRRTASAITASLLARRALDALHRRRAARDTRREGTGGAHEAGSGDHA